MQADSKPGILARGRVYLAEAEGRQRSQEFCWQQTQWLSVLSLTRAEAQLHQDYVRLQLFNFARDVLESVQTSRKKRPDP